MTMFDLGEQIAEYVPVSEDRVPIDRWGKDHWSTLLYVESRIVDYRGKLNHDHMRCHGNRHPLMMAAKRRANLFGRDNGDGRAYPTRLCDGELADHDDYDCIDDMIAEGLVTASVPQPPEGTLITGLVEAQLMTRAVYQLTPKGADLAARLRQHKAAGKGIKNFMIEGV